MKVCVWAHAHILYKLKQKQFKIVRSEEVVLEITFPVSWKSLHFFFCENGMLLDRMQNWKSVTAFLKDFIINKDCGLENRKVLRKGERKGSKTLACGRWTCD